MADFFENLMKRFNENIREETRNQIKLSYSKAYKIAEITNLEKIFNNLCDNYQNLLYLANNKDLNDIIVNSFALTIRSIKDKTRK